MSGTVAVHPLVIVGHVGILINALNLLPIQPTTSDGMRMLQATFEDNVVTTSTTEDDGNNNTQQPTIFPNIVPSILSSMISLFVTIQAFRVLDTSAYLVFYGFVLPLVQQSLLTSSLEIPPRNSINGTNGLRLPFFMVTTFFAIIAISPSF